MKGLIKHTKALAACGIAAGFFAANTLSFAQDAPAPAPAPPQQQQQQPGPDAGWPQAGTAPQTETAQSNGQQQQQEQSQQQPNNGASPAAPANPYGQTPPPPPPSNGPYASQQPFGQQQPYGQPPYTQQQPPYGYNQQPYGGGVYNQPPAPAPAPVPSQIEIPAGTYVTARLNTRLASDKNQPGDAFTATLVDPVVVNGIVVAEPGQTITGQVVEAKKVDGAGRLVVQLTDLALVDGQRVPIQTQLIARRGDRFRANDAGIVAGSTAAGAVIGGAVGWGTGAAVGAGMGALVSLGAVLTHGHASVLYPEEVLTFKIQQPVVISTSNAPQAFRYIQPGEYSAANAAPGPYMQAAPAPYPPAPAYYAYGYPGYYPWYWGPSVGFYFGRPVYYRGYWGGHYYVGGVHRR